MYINAQKRKLDPRDLDTVENAEYFTCIYFLPQGAKIRYEFKTYRDAYSFAINLFYNQFFDNSKAAYSELNENMWRDLTESFNTRRQGWKLEKRRFMFYAVKSTSQTFIGGLK